MIAVAIAPAATGAWDLRGLTPWWFAELAAVAALLTAIVLVGAWQRRAVTIVGFPPIASRASWLTPGARRRGDVLRGVGRDTVAALMFLPFAACACALSWLGWAAPGVAVVDGLILAGALESGTDVETAVGLGLGGLVLAMATPWLWGWIALGAVRSLRRAHDRRGDVARRQAAERQAATIRLSDVFAAERRRIERDLHDGAQQRIVALGFTLGRLEHLLRLRTVDEEDPALALVRSAVDENRLVLADLRALVRSVRPQALTDLGLVAALEEVVARSTVPVAFSATVTQRPGGLVEETAYFVVLEALTNAAKHADAQKIEVSVRRTGDRLEIDVTDDGCGGALLAPDGGLAGLVDRVAAIGGHTLVSSPPGGPTRVSASIPWDVPRAQARADEFARQST